MVATTYTVTIFISMVSLLLAILVGHYSGRKVDSGLIEALVVSAVVIPIGLMIVSTPLYNIAIFDWSTGAYLLPPQIAIWIAGFFGGLIGIKSGDNWNQGEASCIKCLLSLVSLVTLLTLVIVLIP